MAIVLGDLHVLLQPTVFRSGQALAINAILLHLYGYRARSDVLCIQDRRCPITPGGYSVESETQMDIATNIPIDSDSDSGAEWEETSDDSASEVGGSPRLAYDRYMSVDSDRDMDDPTVSDTED